MTRKTVTALENPRPPIAFCDLHLIVVHKPAGLLSVPGRTADKQDCLHQRILKYFPESLVVHRLDRDTSGAILFARSKSVQSELGKRFECGEVHKEYVAWVQGSVRADEGQIDAPIGRAADCALPPRYTVDPKLGKPALTRWQVLAREPERTRLLLLPQTGRSHQLRVHCRQLGHPILGDPIYGQAEKRMYLHAYRLSFNHPHEGDRLEVSVAVPF